MSNDIQTGKIPPIVGNSGASRSQQHERATESATPAASSQAGSADTVSMTDQAARLKKFEAQLADIPHVNPTLVAEMKQAIADGSLDMDYEGTASKLIAMEHAKSNNSKS